MPIRFSKRNYQKIIKVGPSGAVTLDHDFMKRQNWGIGDYVHVDYEGGVVTIINDRILNSKKKGKK